MPSRMYNGLFPDKIENTSNWERVVSRLGIILSLDSRNNAEIARQTNLSPSSLTFLLHNPKKIAGNLLQRIAEDLGAFDHDAPYHPLLDFEIDDTTSILAILKKNKREALVLTKSFERGAKKFTRQLEKLKGLLSQELNIENNPPKKESPLPKGTEEPEPE